MEKEENQNTPKNDHQDLEKNTAKPEENFEKMSKSLVAEEIVKRVIQQIN